MRVTLEDYIRSEILDEQTEIYSTDSVGFFDELRKASRVPNCVFPLNALSLEKRNHYVWDAALECRASVLGYEIPEGEQAVNEECPLTYCLGTSCHGSAAQCFKECGAEYVAYMASEEKCENGARCNVEQGEDGVECTGSTCAYCPGNGEQCVEVPGIVTEEECYAAIACVMPDGSVEFGLTEAECASSTASCSVDCEIDSCMSYSGLEGVCWHQQPDNITCLAYGVENNIVTKYYEGLCILTEIGNENGCEQVGLSTMEFEVTLFNRIQ
tara:strand:- start:423 stop:1232 length:810 start_codon:yes stop_codon:yes gene_type:complete